MWFRIGSVAQVCASTLAPKGPVPNAVAAVFATLLRRNAHFCPRPSSRQSCRKLRPDAAILRPSSSFKSSDSAWGVSRNGSRSPSGSAVLGPTRRNPCLRHSPNGTTTVGLSVRCKDVKNAFRSQVHNSELLDTPHAETPLWNRCPGCPGATPATAPHELGSGHC